MKKYIERCIEETSHYGFKRKNKTFVRVVNDVMQNFVAEKIPSKAFRVNFSINPLCSRIEKDCIQMGMYWCELRRFELPELSSVGLLAHVPPLDAWEYDLNAKESMDACVENIINCLKNHLIPFFERANSCETALPELLKLAKLFNENRKLCLGKCGVEDMSNFDEELTFLDAAKYYAALKIRDWDFALKCRKALLQQNIDSYNSFLANKCKFEDLVENGQLTKEDKIAWEESRTRRESEIARLKYEVGKLEQHDEEYIQKLIRENEVISLDNLRKAKII